MTTIPIDHANLTGSDLHEPKGVASAGSGTVYVADGLGSGSWQSLTNISGALKSVNYYNSSQAITIPNGVTSAYVILWGGSGGGGGYDGSAKGSGGGSGAYAETYLSGLVPARTINLLVGVGGAAGTTTPSAGAVGTSTSLSSGSQVLSTVGANGGGGGGFGASGVPGAGGTAAGANIINETGADGSGSTGGRLFYAKAGNGGFSGTVAQAGDGGGCIIRWMS